MKRSFYTIGSLIILLIAAFVFVLVPIFSGGKMGKRIPAFGSYDGTEIRYEQNTDFANYVAQYADYYKKQGIEISNSNSYYIFDYAFNATVMQLAYTKAVNKSGYVVPEAKINRAMMPYFTDETGNYSSRIYKLADPQRVADMRKSFTSTLTTSRYVEDLFGGSTTFGKKTLYGLKSCDSETAFIQKLSNTSRKLNVAVFNMNDYPESEKIAFGKENADLFTKYDFSVITCADKSKAQNVYNGINTEKYTFDDAIAQHSQKSYSNANGKMTSQYYYQLKDIVKNEKDLEMIGSLQEGAISIPVQTTIGYTIFRADSNAVNFDGKDEQVVKSVYNYITTKEYSRIEDYFTTQGEKLSEAAKTSSFVNAAKSFGAKVVEVPSLPLNYGSLSIIDKIDTSLEGMSGVSTNENFLKTVYSLSKGEISEPVINGKSLLVIQFVSEVTKTEEATPLEALSDEISNYDVKDAEYALMHSPRLKNNMADVFYNYIMSNN